MKIKKSLLSGFIGEFTSAYDFTLFAFLAPVLSKVFFPKGDDTLSLLLTFSVFFIGFVARPIGGIVFGIIGDRYGRNFSLALTFVCLGLPSGIIAFLPSYHAAGILSPSLLVLMRIFQGFGAGGEFTNSIVFFTENSLEHTRYSTTSLCWTGSLAGTLFGSILTGVSHQVFTDLELISWGWRGLFLIGSANFFVGIYLRLSLKETAAFLDLQKKHKILNTPITYSFKHQSKNMLLIAGISVQLASLSYICNIYMPTYLHQWLDLTNHFTLNLASLNLTLLLLLIPLFSYISDKTSGHIVFIIALVCESVFVIPLFYLINLGHLFLIVLAQGSLSILTALSMATLPYLIIQKTTPETRCSTVSLPHNIVVCLFGGAAPMIVTALIKRSHDLLIPAYFLFITSIFTLFTYLFLYKKIITRNTDD